MIRDIQPDIREMDYHCTLGGGVLNTGWSDKDLDLFFLLCCGGERDNKEKLWDYLNGILGPLHALRDGPDYMNESGWEWREQLKGHYLGKRVDIFIL